MKFPIGKLVITRNAHATLSQDDVNAGLASHANGDWGVGCEEDKQQNDWSVDNGERIFSAHETQSGKCWVMTERDRSYTTVNLKIVKRFCRYILVSGV